MKTYAGWEGSLNEYLSIDDLVDEGIVNYFINVLPPACFTSQVIQMGESYSHIGGKPTFPTLKKTSQGWAYAGNCFMGQTENQG
ncbi:hypothetical protein [Paenibacillus tyrfis]|uniref:hypothetical protein n=1 Tax=Paenibacillus tyrfis TaxID=1501230 RepID=UPI002164FA2B|nr:hypothetical protein [Paenibacillus tyrfis]